MSGSKYGVIYKTTEFISKIIPKSKEINLKNLEYINNVISFIMELDKIQQSNQSITLSIHANDGIWVYYNLQCQFLIKPSQKYIILLIWGCNTSSKAIKNEKVLFKDVRTTSYEAKKYHITKSELDWLLEFFNNLVPSTTLVGNELDSVLHPRHIPGDVRQITLSEFENSGRICNGVKGRTKKHKVEKNAQIEFDHILPYSRGGSNSYNNIQILCKECNRIKSNNAI